MKKLLISLFLVSLTCVGLSAADTALPIEPAVLMETIDLFAGVDAVPATVEELEAAEGEGIFGGILVGCFSFLGGVFFGGVANGTDEARYGAGGMFGLNGFIIGFFSTPF